MFKSCYVSGNSCYNGMEFFVCYLKCFYGCVKDIFGIFLVYFVVCWCIFNGIFDRMFKLILNVFGWYLMVKL